MGLADVREADLSQCQVTPGVGSRLWSKLNATINPSMLSSKRLFNIILHTWPNHLLVPAYMHCVCAVVGTYAWTWVCLLLCICNLVPASAYTQDQYSVQHHYKVITILIYVENIM